MAGEGGYHHHHPVLHILDYKKGEDGSGSGTMEVEVGEEDLKLTITMMKFCW